MKVAIIIRTCLQYDGRVLAQIVTLANEYKSSAFTVYVYPNCKSEGIKLPENVIVIDSKLWTLKLPGSNTFLFIKQIHFGFSMLNKLIKSKPDIIHVHDEFPILGALIYKKFFNRKVNLVYDDHELYNLDANPSLYRRLRKFLEFKMFSYADQVNMANSHRAVYAKSVVKCLNDKEINVIDNFPFTFFQSKIHKVETFKKEKGIKYLLHQGEINENRGKQLLVEVIKHLPENWRIVLLGLPMDQFRQFVDQYKDLAKWIVNGGRVPNDQIIAVYDNFDASVVFYKTEMLNEKYCAPNRLYQAANAGLPLIVNDNPALLDFITINKTGIAIDREIEEIVNNINRFFRDYNIFFENARKLKGEFLYEEKVAPKLIEVYQQIINA
jgi:glycosyltransferase involved in cell wall biosynthesis